jgi:hypothetical protein
MANSSCLVSGYGGSESNYCGWKSQARLSKIQQTKLAMLGQPCKQQKLWDLADKKALSPGPVGIGPAACNGFDHAEHCQTDQEIHQHPEIDPGAFVASSQWQIPHQQKVDGISTEDRRQGVNKIGRLLGHT